MCFKGIKSLKFRLVLMFMVMLSAFILERSQIYFVGIPQANSAPTYCAQTAFSKEPSCFASAPGYCSLTAYSKEPSCVASHPEYCSLTAYSKEPSCFASAPEYCSLSAYANEPTCVASHPDYCEYIAYSKTLACAVFPENNALQLYCRYFDRSGLCPRPPSR